MKAKPFVKWAGGKTQLLDEIDKRLPKEFKNYFEPFVGAGALYWHLDLTNKKAHINDISGELINTYKMVQKHPKELMKRLDFHAKEHETNPKEYYYQMRGMDRKNNWLEVSEIDRAARFIYLNKTSFNGLWRENSLGQNNVPWNHKNKVNLYDKKSFEQNYKKLRKKTNIYSKSFEEIAKKAKKEDFVFFDPPYDLLNNQTFESYTKDKFGREGQVKLAKLAKELKDRGCYVMITNHNTKLINELYGELGFTIEPVKVKRLINSNASKREGTEVIICSYDYEKQ